MGFVPGAFGPLAVAERRDARRRCRPGGRSRRRRRSPSHTRRRASRSPRSRACSPASACSSTPPRVASGWRRSRSRSASAPRSSRPRARRSGMRCARWGSTTSTSRPRARPRSASASRRRGIDVVLNCLTGELVDASLGLLAAGGRFVELGVADVRDRAAVAAAHEGVRYERLDLFATAPARLGEMLEQVVGELQRGELAALPLTAFDVRERTRGAALRQPGAPHRQGRADRAAAARCRGDRARQRRHRRARRGRRRAPRARARRPPPAARQPPRAARRRRRRARRPARGARLRGHGRGAATSAIAPRSPRCWTRSRRTCR